MGGVQGIGIGFTPLEAGCVLASKVDGDVPGGGREEEDRHNEECHQDEETTHKTEDESDNVGYGGEARHCDGSVERKTERRWDGGMTGFPLAVAHKRGGSHRNSLLEAPPFVRSFFD